MKVIKVLSIVLIASLISTSNLNFANENSSDEFPCKSKKEILDKRKEALDQAQAAYDTATRRLITFGITGLVRSMGKDSTDRQQMDDGKATGKDMLDRKAAKAALDQAQTDHDQAEQDYNDCREKHRCEGCGQVPKHPLHATCWNSGNGCNAPNVRQCTHDCDYEDSKMITGACGHKYPKVHARMHRQIGYDCGKHSWFWCKQDYDSLGHVESYYNCYSHSYHECDNPSDETKEGHKHQMYPCGLHGDYKCQHAAKEASHPARKLCPKQNGKACLYKYHRKCSPHVHYYDY
ncbi:MAG: hypothetical protein OXI43_13535 [Candidatus Poribacteria bacterium]|nr:hypothetical protein [Candidatus Poribacteria bacterium]